MKKIFLYTTLISFICFAHLNAMRPDANDFNYKHLENYLRHFSEVSVTSVLDYLKHNDSENILWKQHRLRVLEYARLAVTTAQNSHDEITRRYAPVPPAATVEIEIYYKSFDTTVAARLIEKKIQEYDLYHNK